MELHDPGLTVAVALAAGIIAQGVAIHLRIPGIVLTLAAGVVLGPELLGLVHPDSLGDGLGHLVGFAVAVVLFEGGLNLNIGQLRHEAQTIRRLITVGGAITAVGGSLAAGFFMGWDWRMSILFGTLVVVTGPTVINPLTRRIRLKTKLRTILEAEGVLIDPIGAVLAVVALEVILELSHSGAAGAAEGLLGLPYRLGLGFAVGAVGGLAIGLLLRRKRVVPEGFENIFTLALVLALFEVSDFVLEESGIMAVAIAGLVVGNMRTRVKRDLREFKEQLTILLVGLLFVLLAADVNLADVWALGWGGVATVLALILVVRPANIAVSAAGSELSRNEKALLAWIAPRGIVAFAIASLFGRRLVATGVGDGSQFVALVFLVIAVTVIVQGGTAGFLAGALGVRRPGNRGWVIVGANALGRALAAALRDGSERDEPILLVDSNAHEAKAAESEGFRVLFGNASDERTLLRADVEGRRGFVALTPNEGVNLLLAQRALEEFRVPRALVLLRERDPGVVEEQVHGAEARVLFGAPVDFESWSHDLLQGQTVVERRRFTGTGRVPIVPPAVETAGGRDQVALLPLAVVRGSSVAPVDSETQIKEADEVIFIWLVEHDERVRGWLAAASWEPVEAVEDVEAGDDGGQPPDGSTSSPKR
jgi:NhaP-type Na+/H+ or K+/H+ antiporter